LPCANPTRRDILDMLLGGERAVVAIAERFDMARAADPTVTEADQCSPPRRRAGSRQ